MATKQAEQKRTDLDARERDKREEGLLEAVILDAVLTELGRPTEQYRVQVKRVWGNNYRVNVLMGPDSVSLRMAHSYFLTADANGKILTSTPTLKKVY